ncbi:GNAT family N-acetyltransferase [Streptomyces sp. NBC_00536]|uniref:GNAT family N-acetyltransferase n=1 Tax=Streptomyces sp. NBC_00536 TaxID=2975769 RepID=UPI002E81B828|nr:GNAT family N-acetyltransferase [Streptomyces sp. NBC_00536]WUC79352.1 GNAT family N-acetyltransferase [Streptomyces sp. NBC_00536]
MEPSTLTTERLILRPHLPTDITAVHAACQDPAIQQWIPVPVPYEVSDAEAYVCETVPGGWREDTAYNFAVLLGTDGPLVATLGVHPRSSYAHEIGYWSVAEHRGNGYMTEAVTAVARWAFTEAGCDRLIWRAGTGNTASRAVAEKCGFVVEGVHRSGMEHRETLRDCWIGALLPSDLGLPSRLPYLPTPPRDA